MIGMSDIIMLFWLHFIGDFVLQSKYMALNKSKRITPLLLHCIVYSLPFLWFGWIFAFWACLLHFPVDYVSSKITSKLWEAKEVHWFFRWNVN